jgi:hypothetical protein
VADLDKGDLARHVEGGWPAEALDVEATGGGEVGHSERNEVHAGLHGWIVSEVRRGRPEPNAACVFRPRR